MTERSPKTSGKKDHKLIDLSKRMSDLYVAECMAKKARLEVETECRRIIAESQAQCIDQAREHSKKLEAPILAKVCEVGFFCDAHVIKTNHVTLEMGADYFVECSVHTADQIITRRNTQLLKERDDGLESIRLLDDKMAFCKENFRSVSMEGDLIEICETYDVGMEAMFYENRKKRAQEKKEQQEKDTGASDKEKDHQQVMERLDELEKLEESNEEIEKVVQEEVPMPQPFEIPHEDIVEIEEYEEDTDEDVAKRFGMSEHLLAQPGVSRKEMEALLQFLEDQEKSSDEEDEEDEEEEENALDSDDYDFDETEEDEKDTENTEKRTPVRRKSSVRFAEELESVKTFFTTDKVEVKQEDASSPAAPIETKSILRSTEPTPVNHALLQKEAEQKELAAMSTVTFPGEIVEKDPYECEPSTSKDPAPVITEGKVSKFRASRNRR